jgi:hypothetical protein
VQTSGCGPVHPLGLWGPLPASVTVLSTHNADWMETTVPTLRTLTALAAAAVSLAAAPGALAHTTPVGHSDGTPTMNVCPLSQDCTYVNFRHGQPTDVVKHSGTLVDWSVNAGSTGGGAELRILRPAGHGTFKAVHSSALETVSAIGLNTFSAHIKVRRGDVLALSNDSSGIYMESAPAGQCVRDFSSTLSNGTTGRPDQVTTQLHLLLSADVHV